MTINATVNKSFIQSMDHITRVASYIPRFFPLVSTSTFKEVPEALHTLEFFSTHTCSITSLPIRFIVADKRHPDHFYEKEAIVEWINRDHRSPLTRESMTTNDLVECPEIQRTINQILFNRYLEQKYPAIPDDLEPQIDADLYGYGDPWKICPLTEKRIRFPVSPVGHPDLIYERKAAVDYIVQNSRLPFSEKTMTIAELNPCIELQKKINERLTEYDAWHFTPSEEIQKVMQIFKFVKNLPVNL